MLETSQAQPDEIAVVEGHLGRRFQRMVLSSQRKKPSTI